MGTTLTNGVYLPNEGERNCYAGLKTNWEILDQKVADVTALQQAVAGALHREIVESLPTTDIDPNTIYMVLSGTSATENVYNEYMHVNNAWELIGTSATDLTNYYTKSEVDGKLLSKANASDLTSHTGDTTIHVTTADKTSWNTVTSKANDSDVVHKSGNEIIGGNKTFSDSLTIYNNDSSQNTKNLTISSSKIQVGDTSNSDSFGIVFNAGLSYVSRIIAFKDTSGTQNLQFGVRTKDSSNNFIGAMIRLRSYANGFSTFESDGDNFVSLGSSSNKWKNVQTYQVNNLEPSSLSLPSGNANDVIDISSYITHLDGTSNSYTVPANGWISISVIGTAIDIVSSSWSDSRLRASSGNVRMLYPVIKNEVLDISVSGTTLTYARFIPCQGNI